MKLVNFIPRVTYTVIWDNTARAYIAEDGGGSWRITFADKSVVEGYASFSGALADILDAPFEYNIIRRKHYEIHLGQCVVGLLSVPPDMSPKVIVEIFGQVSKRFDSVSDGINYVREKYEK